MYFITNALGDEGLLRNLVGRVRVVLRTRRETNQSPSCMRTPYSVRICVLYSALRTASKPGTSITVLRTWLLQQAKPNYWLPCLNAPPRNCINPGSRPDPLTNWEALFVKADGGVRSALQRRRTLPSNFFLFSEFSEIERTHRNRPPSTFR